MDPGLVAAYLGPYVERGTWDHIVDAVSHHLEDVTVTMRPVPTVIGSAAFNPFAQSPAWEALGAAAFLGLSDDEPFAVRVVNLDESSAWGVQTFVVDPPTDRLYEVLDNRNTGGHMMRYYLPVTRGTLERAGQLGPLSLTEVDRTTISELPNDIAMVCYAASASAQSLVT